VSQDTATTTQERTPVVLAPPILIASGNAWAIEDPLPGTTLLLPLTDQDLKEGGAVVETHTILQVLEAV